MRLRIEVTQADIAKAKARPWTAHRANGCPAYRALVRTTGYRRLSVSQNQLTISWGRMHEVCALPAEVTQRIKTYDEGKGAHGQMEPFTFELELDVRWAKLIFLHAPRGSKRLSCFDPCVHCGAHPREPGRDQCAVCQLEVHVPGTDLQEPETAASSVPALAEA